ncbi:MULTISPECIES: CsbD family protein [unclassified Streptomyces]
MKGQVEETAGKATGNDRLKMKGKADQVKGDAKQVVEKSKDTLDH